MTAINAFPDANPLGTQNVGRLIVKYSVPAIISGFLSAIYNMVDQIFIGWGIGDLGMAATNVAFPFTTICLAVALLLGIGGASNMSLSLGNGDKERARSISGNTLALLAASGIVIGALSFIFLEPLLVLFGATEAIMVYARPYTLIIAIGIPFFIFSVGASHLIRADGSPAYAMISMTAGAVFNLIADPLFLFVFDMGIEGIAWATTIGQMLSTAIALFYLLRKAKIISLKKQYFRLKAALIGAICTIGAAGCVNQLAMTVVQVALNNLLTHYGELSAYGSELPLAVAGAISKIQMLFLVVVLGVAQGCQPIIGYNYGAKKYGRVIDTYKYALIAVCLYAVPIMVCFQLFPAQILSIFGSKTAAFYEFGSRYMRIYMMMLILIPLQLFTSNFFTAIGKSVLGLIMSLSRQILFLLPLLYLFTYLFGLDGILYSGPIADVAAAVITVIFIIREVNLLRKRINLPPLQSDGSAQMPSAAQAPDAQSTGKE